MKNNMHSLNTTSDSQCKYNGTFWNMITGIGGTCDVPPGYNKKSCSLIGNDCYSNTASQCKRSDDCYFDFWEYRCMNKDPSKGSLNCKSNKKSWYPFDCECTTINPGIHPINLPSPHTINPGIHPINFPSPYPINPNIHPINFPSPHTINPGIHPFVDPCSSNTWTKECKNKIINMLKTKYGITNQNILNCCMEYLTKKTTPNNIPDNIIYYIINNYCQPCDTVWTQSCINRLGNYILNYRPEISEKAFSCSINLIISRIIPSSLDNNISIINYFIDECIYLYP